MHAPPDKPEPDARPRATGRQPSSRNEALSALAAGIAHDINDMMVGALGNAQMLMMQLGQSPDARAMLTEIAHAAQRAGELARQFQILAGGAEQRQPVNINTLLQESRHIIDRALPERIHLEPRIEPKLRLTDADPVQIVQAILNLMTHSIESIEQEGSVRIRTANVMIEGPVATAGDEMIERIETGNAPEGPCVMLEVAHTGRALDAEARRHLFSAANSDRNLLNLIAVREIAEKNGGALTLHAPAAQGAAFRIYLPAMEGGVHDENRGLKNLPRGQETILVIDDEEIVLNVLRIMLGKLGYQPLLAQTAEEGLAYAQNHEGPIDLTILDIVLPVSSGAEVYPQLKELRPEMKVIVCSGYAEDQVSQKLLELGANAFVPKPFRLEALAPTIRKVLDGEPAPQAE